MPPFRWNAPRCYGELAESSLWHWRRLGQDSPIKFFPSLSTGYDPRPWIGAVDCKIVTNVAAAAFRRICEDAKKFSDETGERYLLMGPLDEWGEGSIGYPNRQHGFGMLEAVRDTFGEKPLSPNRIPISLSPQSSAARGPRASGGVLSSPYESARAQQHEYVLHVGDYIPSAASASRVQIRFENLV